MQLCPYLDLNGRAEEALSFYADVLGGKVAFLMRYAGSPMAGDMPADQQQRVMHGEVHFGDQVLMGADPPPPMAAKPQGIAVQVALDTVEQAERVFARLAEGGEVRMKLEETFWAERFGMCVDRFGIPWLVNGPAKPM